MFGEATKPFLRKTILSESSFTQPYMHGSPQTFLLPEGEAAVVPPGGFQWNFIPISILEGSGKALEGFWEGFGKVFKGFSMSGPPRCLAKPRGASQCAGVPDPTRVRQEVEWT